MRLGITGAQVYIGSSLSILAVLITELCNKDASNINEDMLVL